MSVTKSVRLAFNNPNPPRTTALTSDGYGVLGFCLQARCNNFPPLKSIVVYCSNGPLCHFTNETWLDLRMGCRRNLADRPLYEKWHREFTWACENIPDFQWGIPQNNPRTAQFINLQNHRIGRRFHLVGSSSTPLRDKLTLVR